MAYSYFREVARTPQKVRDCRLCFSVVPASQVEGAEAFTVGTTLLGLAPSCLSSIQRAGECLGRLKHRAVHLVAQCQGGSAQAPGGLLTLSALRRCGRGRS